MFFVDGEEVFFLTVQELRELGLLPHVLDLLGSEEIATELEIELEEEKFDRLKKEVVIPRGKRYAIGLLSDRDYTEKKLRDKLKESGYRAEDCDVIVDYLKDRNFLDDLRYATSFVRTGMRAKSRRYLEGKLFEKGISKEISALAFERAEEELKESGEDAEEVRNAAIRKQLDLKLRKKARDDSDAVTKALQSLMRKGFLYGEIKKEIEEYYKNRQD